VHRHSARRIRYGILLKRRQRAGGARHCGAGNPGDADSHGLQDRIPSGEKIQNWTTIFSFVVMRHLDVDMAYVRSFNQQRFFTTCVAEHPLPVNKPDRMEYGYRIAEWTQACPMTISGPSNGHPEIDMVKFIQGKSVDAFVMVGFRFAPSPELVQEWQATLDEVFLRTKES
jgi:hypothetical protein